MMYILVFVCYNKQGYEAAVSDYITVTAHNNKGALYAGTTLCQILYQDSLHASVPKGKIRDYPQYEVRSMAIDVARIYIPLDYLEEITKYMAYYKLNEIHLGLSNDGGEQSSAFRLESKKYPEINEGIDVYTQEEYKAYQKEVKKYGVRVVSEIDTPAHSGWVAKHNPEFMNPNNNTYINLDSSEAKAFIKSIYDEFLDGDDPVIQSDTFHMGTDEYVDAADANLPEKFAGYRRKA